jgi:hypothetical protein
MQQQPGGMQQPPPFPPGRPPVQQQQGVYGYGSVTQQKQRMDVRLLGLLGLLALILIVGGVLYATGVFPKETTPATTSPPSDQQPSGSTTPSDTNPPAITSISDNVSTSAATIRWTTDVPSTSQVEYGITSSYGNTTDLDTELVTSHSVSLSGLESGTTYRFRVKSADEAGNKAVSSEDNFTTSAVVPVPKLEIVQDNVTYEDFGGGAVLSTISGSVKNTGEANVWAPDVIVTVKYTVEGGDDEVYEKNAGLLSVEPGAMKPGQQREFEVVIADNIEEDYEISAGVSP